jgi:hypothetical protein
VVHFAPDYVFGVDQPEPMAFLLVATSRDRLPALPAKRPTLRRTHTLSLPFCEKGVGLAGSRNAPIFELSGLRVADKRQFLSTNQGDACFSAQRIVF